MSTPELPAETIDEVLDIIGDDSSDQFVAGTLCKFWLLRQRRRLFSKSISFKNEEHIVRFDGLTSESTCTFTIPIVCENLMVRNLTTMGSRGNSAVRNIISRIQVSKSITLDVSAGDIPPPITAALKEWGKDIRELTISGGTHDPTTFYAALASLHIETLTLQDFKFTTVTAQGPVPQHSFPPTLKNLSLVRSAQAFIFFKTQLMQGSGFTGIDVLSIKTLFSFEEVGVVEMLECLCALTSIGTIKLQALYDASRRDLDRHMGIIFSSPCVKPLKIKGLERLELDFTRAPAHLALNCLCMFAMYLPRIRNAITVDIKVPSSLELWDEEGPAVQLERLVREVDGSNPLLRGPPRSTLVVRGYPARLPESVRTSPRLCQHPVIFVDADD